MSNTQRNLRTQEVHTCLWIEQNAARWDGGGVQRNDVEASVSINVRVSGCALRDRDGCAAPDGHGRKRGRWGEAPTRMGDNRGG